MAISVGLLAAHLLRKQLPGTSPDGRGEDHFEAALLSLPLWLAAFARYRLYQSRHVASRLEEVRGVVHATACSVLLLLFAAQMAKLWVERRWLVLSFPLVSAAVVIEREVVRRAFKRMRRGGRYCRTVVIVGANTEGLQLCSGLREQSLGYRVVGFTDDTVPVGNRVLGRWPILAGIAGTASAVSAVGANTVLITSSAVDVDTSNVLARNLVEMGVHVEVSATLRDIDPARLSIRELGRFPTLYVAPVVRTGWRPTAKRCFDVVVAGLLLLGVLPVLLVAAVVIKLDSPGPVVFRQQRMGRDARPFRCFKLRTMVVGAEARLTELAERNEAGSAFFKVTDDPRITRAGRFLRRSSLDELPQLWNVLRGDMSLVGPRPLPVGDVQAHWGPFMEQRLVVPPGLTGLWQVMGRSAADPEDYERFDRYYVDNWSLSADLGILVRTVHAVLTARGAK
jgi:exopolysaccharide biosynthesis polyprenyl glycosylphosphotransferase